MDKIAGNIDWTPISNEQIPEPSLDILLGVNSRLQEILITSILSHTSHRVHVVESGKMALESLVEHPFDLCLFSVHMSELNGLETCQLIRKAHQTWQQIPIIGLLEQTSPIMMANCLSAGMNTFLCPAMSAHKVLSMVYYYQNKLLSTRC